MERMSPFFRPAGRVVGGKKKKEKKEEPRKREEEKEISPHRLSF